MNNHVFVSHSHEDSSTADLIVKALEERGTVCWVAPRDVPPGGSYAEAILNAIESASCFVLIYSANSNVSSHVLREVERALKFGVNIVPVRFDDSTPSKSLDYLLATVHWLSVASDSRDRSIGKAAEQIAACVARFQTPRRIPEPDRVSLARTPAAPDAPVSKRHLLWIGAAILLALAAGLVGFFFSRNSSRLPSAQSEVASPTKATPPATPAVATTVRSAQTEMPLAVAHRYFAFISQRNATAAYNLLSADFRRRLSIVKYSRNVGSTPPVKLLETTIVSQTERTASVAAVFEDTNPESRQARWHGPLEFVLEPGGWRIDSMKGLWPASGRPHDLAGGSSEETTPDSSESPAESASSPKSIVSPSPAHQAVYGVVRDPDGVANVREGPFIHARIMAVVKNGERVEIDQMQGDWMHIILGPGRGGFVHKSRVQITPAR